MGARERRLVRHDAAGEGEVGERFFCAIEGYVEQVAEAFHHLGFPDYFRVQLSWAKLAGIVLLLAPVPARVKEWAYAGFAFDLGSAVIAHLAVGDGPEAWGWAAGTLLLGAVSYYFWRRTSALSSASQARLSTSTQAALG